MNKSISKETTTLFLSIILYWIPFLALTQTASNGTDKAELKSHIAIFEIPASDISRAVAFYEAILDISKVKCIYPQIMASLFTLKPVTTYRLF